MGDRGMIDLQQKAARILAEAICLNDLPATFTRATPAWHPYERRLVASGERRQRNVYWGGGYQFPGDVVERTSTNLLVSDAFDTAAWTKTDTTPTANAALAPDNTVTACLMTTGTAGNDGVQQNATITASQVYTASVCVKLAPGSTMSWCRLIMGETSTNFLSSWFNLSTGVKGSTSIVGSGWSSPTSNIENIGGGWYRISLTGTASANTTARHLVTTTTGDLNSTRVNNATYYIWRAQLEQKNWASTIISSPTAGTVRNDESLLADLTGLPGGGLRRDEGTIIATWSPLRLTGTAIRRRIFGGGSESTIRMSMSSSGQEFIQRNSSVDVSALFGTVDATPIGALVQHAGTWTDSATSLFRSGTAKASTSNDQTFDAQTSLYIGSLSASADHVDGLVSLLYWQRALTAAEIATLAKSGGYYGV
jgi:hypothetical protein